MERYHAWASEMLGRAEEVRICEGDGRPSLVARGTDLDGASSLLTLDLDDMGRPHRLAWSHGCIERRGGGWVLTTPSDEPAPVPQLEGVDSLEVWCSPAGTWPVLRQLTPGATARTCTATLRPDGSWAVEDVEWRDVGVRGSGREVLRRTGKAEQTLLVDDAGLLVAGPGWRSREPRWSRHAAVYQVYPRSFADSDGDGIGDLPGLVNRVGHVADLGADAVWINPFYPSPLADGGYDVADPCDVDPRLGGLGDVDRLLAALHRRGLALMIDVVPNHVSSEHPWFRQALAEGPGSPARRLFHFRDAGETPPNDWTSAFGGPAWTQAPDGQWYHHLHAPEQPDLNWDHPRVRAEYLRVLAFWADRGVDGFRIDVANTLLKDVDSPHTAAELAVRATDDGAHPLTDREGLTEVYGAWRALLDSYDPPRATVAEAAVTGACRGRYSRMLQQAFDFDVQDADLVAGTYRDLVMAALEQARADGTTPTWLLGSHDAPRPATRLGFDVVPEHNARETTKAWLLTDGGSPANDRALGLARQRAAAAFLAFLPGCLYVHQGEELGLPEVGDLPWEVLADPLAHRSQGREKGRDGARVPLPWHPDRGACGGGSFGFGPGGAHLPQPDSFGPLAVEVQDADPASTLTLYRRLLSLRRLLEPGLDLTWHHADPDVLHVARDGVGGTWHCLLNLSTAPVPAPAGRVLVTTTAAAADGKVPSTAAAWVLVRRA